MNKKITGLVQKLHKYFIKNGLTLSVAESCTGGLISHYITALPGASNFFEAGVVSYSAEAKKKILRVSSKTISKFGVVSEETAKEMAEKIRLLIGTDFSISTTGNLGPDVLEGKERGLIYIALSKRGKTFSKKLRLKGNRGENKEQAALEALKFLMKIVES
jgi:PncC family amidohydrolase